MSGNISLFIQLVTMSLHSSLIISQVITSSRIHFLVKSSFKWPRAPSQRLRPWRMIHGPGSKWFQSTMASSLSNPWNSQATTSRTSPFHSVKTPRLLNSCRMTILKWTLRKNSGPSSKLSTLTERYHLQSDLKRLGWFRVTFDAFQKCLKTLEKVCKKVTIAFETYYIFDN